MDLGYVAAELIIAGLVYIAVSCCVGGFILAKYGRRKRALGIMLAAFGFGTLLVTIYGSFIEPYRIVVRHETIDLSSYTGPSFKITLLSDMHLGRFNNTGRTKQAIEAALKLDTDYYLLLGDTVNENDIHLDDMKSLAELAKQHPTYAIYGNHDYTYEQEDNKHPLVEGLKETFDSYGITVLANTTTRIGPNDSVALAGIHDRWSVQDDITTVLETPADDTLILLSHNPDSIDRIPGTSSNTVDLVLSGHTHGGEIQIPGFGALHPLPTDLPHSYDKGLFTRNDIPLYITSGIGNIGIRMRLFNPPEIVVITII